MEKADGHRIKTLILGIRRDKLIGIFDEASIIQIIVLPILKELGWAIFDPDEVKPENSVYSVSNNKTDYSLYSLRINGSNKVSLEVRKVIKVLGLHQLSDFSFQEGANLAVLTNGEIWLFYLPPNKN